MSIDHEIFGPHQASAAEFSGISLKMCLLGILVGMIGAYILWGWGGAFLTAGLLLLIGGLALYACRNLITDRSNAR